MSSLPQIISHTVQLHGDKVATRMGSRSRTWSELQDRVARLAHGAIAITNSILPCPGPELCMFRSTPAWRRPSSFTG